VPHEGESCALLRETFRQSRLHGFRVSV
jgi:hypothetical protein